MPNLLCKKINCNCVCDVTFKFKLVLCHTNLFSRSQQLWNTKCDNNQIVDSQLLILDYRSLNARLSFTRCSIIDYKVLRYSSCTLRLSSLHFDCRLRTPIVALALRLSFTAPKLSAEGRWCRRGGEGRGRNY